MPPHTRADRQLCPEEVFRTRLADELATATAEGAYLDWRAKWIAAAFFDCPSDGAKVALIQMAIEAWGRPC